MRLLIDVHDAADNRLGSGPLFAATSASVTRPLDGVGTVSVEMPATDRRAVELIDNKRRLVIWVEQPGKPLREMGRMIVDDVARSTATGGRTMSITGPTILAELKYANTLLGRQYNQQSISAIVGNLTALASGWSSTASGTDNLLSARYDGAPVVKAIESLVTLNGLHYRLGASGKVIEVGAFGASAGLTLVKPNVVTPEMMLNDDIGLIESIKSRSDSEEVVTWLLPLAGGQNADSSLTLQYSDRVGPYPTQSMTGPDGRTLYFKRNMAANALYGTIQKVGTFKEIAPLSNTDGDIRNASNALSDAADAALDRYSLPQKSYTIGVKKCTKTIRAGDKVTIWYVGEVEREDGRLVFEEIRGDFWVMKATEKCSAGGITLDLEVSNIDRYARDTGRIILGAMEEIRVQGISVQPSYNRSNMGPYSYAIDSSHPVTIPLKITNATFELDRCLLTVRSRPLRANATGAQASTSDGSAHIHAWGSVLGTPDAGAGFTIQTFSFQDSGGNIWRFNAASNFDPGVTTSVMTATDTPPHDHTIPTIPLDYGIYDDTILPENIRVKVDGVVVANQLGETADAVNEEIDITQVLIDAGLRQEHTILIECAAGQGEIEVQIELYDKITPFRIGA